MVCTAYWQKIKVAVAYTRSEEKFTTIPFDEISSSDDSIILRGNDLSDITFFPPFPQLAKLSLLEQPRVTVFPNLENISASLDTLVIKQCSLSYIEPNRLQILVNLEILDLGANFLTSPFPDMNAALGCSMRHLTLSGNQLYEMPYLPTIAKFLEKLYISSNFNITHLPKETLGLYRTLTTLDYLHGSLRSLPDFSVLAKVHRAPTRLFINLGNNQITSIDAKDLRPLIGTNWYLGVKSNPVKHIMNMLHLGSRKDFYLESSPVLCDCRLRWLRAAGQHQRTAVAAGGVKCDGPGSITGKLQDIPYEDPVCNGKSASKIR